MRSPAVSADETRICSTASSSAINTGCCVVNCNNDDEIYSFHPGGANVLCADGSVHFLNANTPIQVIANLITRAGGETIASDAIQ